VAGLSCATSAAQGPPNLRPSYLEVAKGYAAGERAAAVADLGRFSPAELGAEMEALRARVRSPACAGCPTAESPPLRAIVLLHTDRDELEARSYVLAGRTPPCGVGVHAELAERAVALVPADAQSRDFTRRWYLAMALRSLGGGCLGDAGGWARAGLKGFPRDADLLFTNGTINETTASVAIPTPPSVGPSTRAHNAFLGQLQERHRLFEEARKAFEQVLTADPTRDEARLHLARTHLHLQRPEEARKVLEDLLGRSPPPAARYLAHLFLGRVHETEDRLEPAEQHYASAFAQDPAQSAGVALSHVLQRNGESEEARVVLEGALREARGRTVPDPFWVYSFGPTTVHTEMFERLREEAGR
jgi:tetratricopeptide (TPR) repeat protein